MLCSASITSLILGKCFGLGGSLLAGQLNGEKMSIDYECHYFKNIAKIYAFKRKKAQWGIKMKLLRALFYSKIRNTQKCVLLPFW